MTSSACTSTPRPRRCTRWSSTSAATPEFSPEIQRCTWLDGATGPAAGARSEAVSKVSRGPAWKNRPVVIAAQPGREFAFSRTEKLSGTLVWRYRLEPDGSGTRLTESYEVTRPISRLGWFIIDRLFGCHDRRAELRAGMDQTLQRIQRNRRARLHTRAHTARHRQGSVNTGPGVLVCTGLPGVAPGMAVHDAWAPYDTYAPPDHQLCCAHALRELQAVTDAAPGGQWCWAARAARYAATYPPLRSTAWASSTPS